MKVRRNGFVSQKRKKSFFVCYLLFASWFLLLLFVFNGLVLVGEQGGQALMLFALGIILFGILQREAARADQKVSIRPTHTVSPVFKGGEMAANNARPSSDLPGNPLPVSTQKESEEKNDGFWAAGRYYERIGELEARRTENDSVYLDRYGRPVVYLTERFPCFDSSDYLYEDRYFHWHLIWDQNRWTMVKTQDSSADITVLQPKTRTELAAVYLPYNGQKLIEQVEIQYKSDKIQTENKEQGARESC